MACGCPCGCCGTTRRAYEAHRHCAAHLKKALAEGTALLEAFDAKAVNRKRVRPSKRFTPEVATWRGTVCRALDMSKRLGVCAGPLRCLLDMLASAAVPPVLEEKYLRPGEEPPMLLYFGHNERPDVRLTARGELTMRDVAAVRCFAHTMQTAMAAADDVADLAECEVTARDVREAVAYHRRHLAELEGMARDAAATRIQTAWRTCRDVPGYDVWRRRMLREFSELSGLA